MSDLLGFATIALAGLTQASLQLSFGALILLYHASLSRHKRKKTRYLAKSYIWGAAAISFLFVTSFAFIISRFFENGLPLPLLTIVLGILCASALVMYFAYYRRGQHTELWIPRSFSRFITKRAKNTNDAIEAFSLGVISVVVELPLNIALFILAANALLGISTSFLQLTAIFCYAVISVLPLIYLKLTIKSGKTAIASQKWRQKNKQFLKNISGSSFLTLVLFIIAFWIVK